MCLAPFIIIPQSIVRYGGGRSMGPASSTQSQIILHIVVSIVYRSMGR
jgi:hypothetical protein